MQLQRSAPKRADGALTLGRRASEVERGRRHVATACHGYGTDVAGTAVLLASELITNALRHGSGDITVLVTPGVGEIRVDVADESALSPKARRATADDEGGRGLLIVQSLATSWGMESLPQGRGKSVWFTLRVATG
jgi:anti-sigma regulatory factor (Ser/Thr protein kinase)